jgi:methyl-accepting chemotaxis protein
MGWNSFGVRTQVLCLAAGASIFAVATLGAVTAYQSQKSGQEAAKLLRAEVMHTLEEDAKSAGRAVASQAGLLELKVKGQLNDLEESIRRAGGVSLGSGATEWRATNQLTQEPTKVKLPPLMVGNDALPRSLSFGTPIPLLDQSTKNLGGVVTVFQRMNQAGDMLRVATTVRTKAGKRASGTYIPAVSPDGTPGAVISAVLQGETYRGVAFVVDAWNQTEYRPIKDGRGKVIGMIFAGEKLGAVQAVRDYISTLEVGKTGGAFTVVSKGQQKGDFVIPPEGMAEGESSSVLKDASGSPWVEEIITKAGQGQGPVTAIVDIPEKGQTYAAAISAPEWDWVIVLTQPAKDSQESLDALAGAWKSLQVILFLAGICSAVAAGIGAWLTSDAIAGPLRRIASDARRIAEGQQIEVKVSGRQNEIGDLEKAFADISESQNSMSRAFIEAAAGNLAISHEARGEADEAGHALNRMVLSLSRLVDGVRAKASQSQAIANRLEDSAEVSDTSLSHFSQSMKEVALASQETAKTASDLSDSSTSLANHLNSSAEAVASLRENIRRAEESAAEQGRAATETSQVAQKGGASVRETLELLDEIRTRTVGAAEAVRDLDRRQDQVGSFAKSIEQIASQTNLLALNAAIEAARAGEHGLGFAVVADEVRVLAERSGAASRQIIGVLNDIQAGAKNAVSAMEESQVTVEEGAKSGETAKEALSEILASVGRLQTLASAVLGQVQKMTASADSLQTSLDSMVSFGDGTLAAAEELTAGSEELSATMSHVSQELEKQQAIARGVKTLAAELQGASRELADSMAQFKTKENTIPLKKAA